MYIRPETPADYAAIADLHIRAFDDPGDVAVIVALMRQRSSYDPDLSLVAEVEGRVVGHTLFTPCTIMLNGKEERVLVVAPVGVHPDFQKQGAGGKMMTTGHDSGRKKGYPLAFLLGHSSYYPRFGYQTKAFGNSSILIDVASIGRDISGPYKNDVLLETRLPQYDDIPVLQALWKHEESQIDFAIQNDNHLIDWLTPNSSMKAKVYLQDGEIVGYSRGNADAVMMFLAKNYDIARMMAKQIAGDKETLKLPLHPYSVSIGAFDAEPDVARWEAAMVCPLIDNAPLPDTNRLAGRPIWPSAFDLS